MWFIGCSSKEPPPSEVIEIETIEILDPNKNDGPVKPSTAEKSVSSSDKQPAGSDKQPTGSIESEAVEKSEPKEPPSDASN